MDLHDIIDELENYALHIQDVDTAAEALQTSVRYFFDQLQTRPSWTVAELNQLKDTTLVSRSLEALHKSLKTT